MENLIKVNPPLNISDIDKHLFEKHLTYYLNPLKVMRLSNAFVSYAGYVMIDGQLVKESHHDYPDQIPKFKEYANYFYQDTINNPCNLVKYQDNENYLIIHHPWFSNYYHWMMEGLLRIWLVKDEISSMTLVLPEDVKNYEFIINSIEPFKFKQIIYLERNKSAFFKNIVLPQIKPICDSYHYAYLSEIRNFYRQMLPMKIDKEISLGDKLYLSRKKSAQRKIANEDQVETLLKDNGFVVFCNEDYSFWECISIYKNARYLVSIHGAGLTNMLFMNEDAHILELHKKVTNSSDWHSLAYWYMSEALGYSYFQQVCDPINTEGHFFDTNLVVNIQQLEKNIRLMLADKC